MKRKSDHKNDSVVDYNKSHTEHASQFDYCMVFKLLKEGTGKNAKYSQSPQTKYIIDKMKAVGLQVFPYFSVQGDELICLIKDKELKTLQQFAQTIKFQLECDPIALEKTLKEGYFEVDENGVRKKVVSGVNINSDPNISPISPYESIFLQYKTENDSNQLELYSKHNQASPFVTSIRLKLIYNLLRAPRRDGGCNLKISKLIHEKVILCLFPLHDKIVTDQFMSKILNKTSMPWHFPFDDYREYFGEKITMYYVFLSHYSYWLIGPSIIGFIFQLVVWGSGNYSSPVLPFFALIITLWTIIMLEYWKREQSSTALRWGMTDFEQTEQARPEFFGELIDSPITGEKILYFPSTSFYERVAFSNSVVASFIMLVVGVVACIYTIRFSLQAEPDVSPYASTIASVLNTIQITIFNMIYQQVTKILNDMENHRTDTEYEDALIVKLFAFQFINSYASFFFLAFVAANLKSSPSTPINFQGQCGAPNCMQPLALNLAIIFGTRLTVTNFLDQFIPYINYTQKLKNETSDDDGNSLIDKLSPPEKDYVLMSYDSVIEGINNFADTAIQYGFSVLFITALPIAMTFSLISNYAKVKFNAIKLVKFYQRPVPSGCQDIGTWQDIFGIIALAGVITNAAIVCFTMDVLYAYSTFGRAWIFMGFQWVLISVQVIIQWYIPDIPEEVEMQIERMAFYQDKVIEKVRDVADEEEEGGSGRSPSKTTTRSSMQGGALLPSEARKLGNNRSFCPCPEKQAEEKMDLSLFKGHNLPEVSVLTYPTAGVTTGNPMIKADDGRPSL
eukprot:gene10969-14731_t